MSTFETKEHKKLKKKQKIEEEKIEEEKKVEIIFEETDAEKKENKYFKHIYDVLKKDKHYYQHFDEELLLYENKRNGLKTFLANIDIDINTHHSNPHINYSFHITVGKMIFHGTRHKFILKKEMKTLTSDDEEIGINTIRKFITTMKTFKICDKCNKVNSPETRHINDEWVETKEYRDCHCLIGEKRVNDANVIKNLLNIPIEKEKCPICLEIITDKFDACFSPKCEKPHYFHLQCLARAKSNDCPICKVHTHHIRFRGYPYTVMCNHHHEDDDYFSGSDEEDYDG